MKQECYDVKCSKKRTIENGVPFCDSNGYCDKYEKVGSIKEFNRKDNWFNCNFFNLWQRISDFLTAKKINKANQNRREGKSYKYPSAKKYIGCVKNEGVLPRMFKSIVGRKYQ